MIISGGLAIDRFCDRAQGDVGQAFLRSGGTVGRVPAAVNPTMGVKREEVEAVPAGRRCLQTIHRDPSELTGGYGFSHERCPEEPATPLDICRADI